MTAFMITITIIGFLLIFISVSMGKQEDEIEEPYRNKFLDKVESLNPNKRFIIKKDMKGILLSSDQEKIQFVNRNNVDEISKENILQVEIIEDKNSVTKSARGNQIARTALGTILGGTTGAIIGGLSSTKNHFDEVSELGIRIIANDMDNPIREFVFYEYEFPMKSNKPLYKKHYKDVYEWFKTIEVMIARADLEQEDSLQTK